MRQPLHNRKTARQRGKQSFASAEPATAQHHADLALFLSDKLLLTLRHKKGFRVLVVPDNRVENGFLGFRVLVVPADSDLCRKRGL